MKLFELFQTAYDYEKVGDNYYFATPNNNKYKVNYYNVEFFYKWHFIKTVHLGFGLIKDDEDEVSDAVEHTGDAFAVFSTVGRILKEVVQANSWDSFLLAAKRSEPSRVKLYGTFVKHLAKFLPGWKLQFMTDNVYPEYRLWMLVKEGTDVFAPKEKLNELFDKPYALKKDGASDYHFLTKSGDEYAVIFVQDTFLDVQTRKTIHGIMIEFGKRDGNEWDLGVTKSGDQISVFSTVIAAIKEYVKTTDQQYFMFTGSLEEGSRISLYDTFAKMVNKLVPGWKLVKTYDSSFERWYIFSKV